MKNVSKYILINCFEIIESKIRKREDIALAFRTGLISEFIDLINRASKIEFKRNILIFLQRISEKGNSDQTNKLFELGII